MQETWVWSLGWEDALEKGKATHSIILAWRIPWTVESMGLQRVGHDWATFTSLQSPNHQKIRNFPCHLLVRVRKIFLLLGMLWFPGGSEVKESACNSGDLGSIPGWGRSPGEGNGKPLQYSCMENPMDGGALWATLVHGVAKTWTWLSNFTSLHAMI